MSAGDVIDRTTTVAANEAATALDAPARGPWATAWRRLRRDRAAWIAATVLLLLLLASLAAPLYVRYVTGIDPFRSNLDGEIMLDGRSIYVLEASEEGLGIGVTPIGPTWNLSTYFLGADPQGRDVMARLLYGGRTTLLISGLAAIITLALATLIGVCAGFFGGWVDQVLSRFLDVLWAFPVYLFAISLSIVLVNTTIDLGLFSITSGSLAIPILIIGVVYVPYVARPIRGQVLALRRSEFVLAAIGLGAPAHRILLRDILPNVFTSIIVYFPLMLALNVSIETALSFLSLGVQPPDASWGTVIRDGTTLIYTRPWVALAPGIAIVITVVALNILGDSVRDALDPRAKLRA
jgi:peptide/nickel transport system permease protein